MVLLKKQTDLSHTLCSLVHWYCRQFKQTYHKHCANYYNGIVDKSNRPIIDTVLTILMVFPKYQTELSYTLCSLLERYCRQLKQTSHWHCANYFNGIAEKWNRTIIYTMCSLLERYCREIKQTYHWHCANYYNGIAEKSDRPIIYFYTHMSRSFFNSL